MRIELTTSSLPRKCSTPELQRLTNGQFRCGLIERKTRLELATYSLEGYRSTKWATSAFRFENLEMCRFENDTVTYFKLKELYPIETANFQIIQSANFQIELWAEKDSNLRTRERTDLQSVAFSHSAICPKHIYEIRSP